MSQLKTIGIIGGGLGQMMAISSHGTRLMPWIQQLIARPRVAEIIGPSYDFHVDAFRHWLIAVMFSRRI